MTGDEVKKPTKDINRNFYVLVLRYLESMTTLMKSFKQKDVQKVEITNFPPEKEGTSIAVSNFPTVQKVEITNFPPEKETNDDTKEIRLLEELVTEVKKKEQSQYNFKIDPILRQKLKGEDGKDGKDGLDGKDGTEISVDSIADKINSREEIINMSSIKGLLKHLEDLVNYRRPAVINGYSAPTPSNKKFVYNQDGSLYSYSNDRGSKIFTYDSSGLLVKSQGTGVFSTWYFKYTNNVLTDVTLQQ